MIKTVINAWKVAELRQKMLFTIMIIIVFRIGSVIPVPFLNVQALSGMLNGLAGSGAILSYLDTLSGGSFAQATIFALGVSPYITSSIVMQLMTVALPVLENLQKEGEEGRKKLTAITRYLTIFLGLMQGTGYYLFLRNNPHGNMPIVNYIDGGAGIFTAIVIILSFTSGTALVMWLGEQINSKGIGNGVSILMFAGIVARMPSLISRLVMYITLAIENPETFSKFYYFVPLFIVMFLFLIWIIVFMNDAERRIPVQYAKRTVGRKIYGGQSTHIPIKIGIAGVMPVIFAQSILQLPSMIILFINPQGNFRKILESMSLTGWTYPVIYSLLIIMFSYFYVAITYNPIEMANNLRQNNGAIPGIRPGKPTSDYFGRVISKITFLGAVYLAFIALLPWAYGIVSGMAHMMVGGTSIIIMVGVALETVKQMESQLMMRHYKGFLD